MDIVNEVNAEVTKNLTDEQQNLLNNAIDNTQR